MELYWYIIVIIFIIIKIFFYICWYRSRQRQLDAYLSNPRNAQIVIVGGRAYLHQLCERQNQASVWPDWYGVQDDSSIEEPSGSLPPAPSYSQLEVPPPYEAVSRGDDLKPPPYSEFASVGTIPEAQVLNIPENYDACSLSDAPPPYTPSPLMETQQDSTAPPYSQVVEPTTT
uniref:Si:dkey-118j18.2 n=1 Tax=Latimeria chalumnae TaxID=7897 RepID=H3B368_LATCH